MPHLLEEVKGHMLSLSPFKGLKYLCQVTKFCHKRYTTIELHS